ncbi:MAG: hypothetical protein JNL11_00390 [Bdellovibrionaceae bacterium]|nr:hypothetical protein [Pseudobdellovibrionaceae bacterium]
MKQYLSILFLFLISAKSIAGINPEITAFLTAFPDKMICTGTEVNHFTQIRKLMNQKMIIEINSHPR